MIETTDNELIQNCLRGNVNSFETLVVRYQKTVYNAVFRLLGCVEDAEDITQSVFIKVYENLESFDPRYKFYSWIYRIAMNESINFINSRKREEILDIEVATRDQDPDENFQTLERENMIQAALMRIDFEHRVLIVLKHFLDRSYHEIGQILHLPEKKVKSRLYVARQKLAEILNEKGVKKYDKK
jgi:RNA polymerase sigma-70 factor (ECF subfamily)